MLFAGWDQSLTHGALVVLDEDRLVRGHRALISGGVNFAKTREHIAIMPPTIRRESRRDVMVARRLNFLREWFLGSKEWLAMLAVETGEDLILVIEDYAYDAKRGAHQIGEAGGLLRQVVHGDEPWLWPEGGPRVRLHDPSSVKIFATDNGRAEKSDMLAAAYRILADPEDLVLEPGPAQEDTADAICLAEAGRIEWLLREGELTHQHLTAQQRRMVNRTSKAHPVNLLDRPYLRWVDVNP